MPALVTGEPDTVNTEGIASATLDTAPDDVPTALPLMYIAEALIVPGPRLPPVGAPIRIPPSDITRRRFAEAALSNTVRVCADPDSVAEHAPSPRRNADASQVLVHSPVTSEDVAVVNPEPVPFSSPLSAVVMASVPELVTGDPETLKPDGTVSATLVTVPSVTERHVPSALRYFVPVHTPDHSPTTSVDVAALVTYVDELPLRIPVAGENKLNVAAWTLAAINSPSRKEILRMRSPLHWDPETALYRVTIRASIILRVAQIRCLSVSVGRGRPGVISV